MTGREDVEPLRRLSDRQLVVQQWLASVRAFQLEAEALTYRRIEALLESEAGRRAEVLADLEEDLRGGGIA